MTITMTFRHAGAASTPIWQDEKPEATAIRVERQIKEAVLDGRLQPGAVLGSENELAAQFGVSRLPIREALGRLRALGVVEIRTGAGGGARVAGSGNPQPAAEALALQLRLAGVTAAEIFEAQLALETSSVQLAVQVANEEDFARIEAVIDHAAGLVDGHGIFTRASLDVHQAMVDAAHNHVLSATMRAVMSVLYRTLEGSTNTDRARNVIDYHRTVLAALRARDGERLRDLITSHITKVRDSDGNLTR